MLLLTVALYSAYRSSPSAALPESMRGGGGTLVWNSPGGMQKCSHVSDELLRGQKGNQQERLKSLPGENSNCGKVSMHKVSFYAICGADSLLLPKNLS